MKYRTYIVLAAFIAIGLVSFAQTKSKIKKSTPAATTTSAKGKSVFADIELLLKQRCGKCHGPQAESELMLLTYSDVMKGGEHGKVVVPGKPDKSNLVLKLTVKPPFGKQMPKKGEKLNADEIALIKKWITDGAKE